MNNLLPPANPLFVRSGNQFRRLKVLFLAFTACCAFAATLLDASAATTFVWNVASPGANNWNVNANWLPGTGNPAAGDTALFGITGTNSADSVTPNNIVSVNTTIAALTYTNNLATTWHVTKIPAGVTLSVTGNLTVGGGTGDGFKTGAALVDAGTLVVGGNVSIGNNGSSSIDNGTVLDLSGLNNFVSGSGTASFTLGINNRSVGDLKLANTSNSITAATVALDTANSSSSGSGTVTLGSGTNIINANTFNAGGNRGQVTIQFPGATGGLRVRGAGGTDADRATMTLGNHNTGGSGSTSAGTLSLNGHPVDMKLATLNLGVSSSGPTGNSPGNGTINFDTGVIDATNINLATSAGSTASALANGTITAGTNATLGTNGLLLVGGSGISMGNQTAASGTATGTLNINGGAVRCFGDIRRTNSSGSATIAISGGSLNMAGITNVVGSPSFPINNLNLTDSSLTVPAFAGNPSVSVSLLTISGSTDTINVTAVPGLGQFQLIAYSGSINGAYDFTLGSLPGGYQGYISNNVAASSVDLVITNTSSKTDTWRGNISGNWDTSTANWVSGGNPSTFVAGDIVIFNDTLTGTPNVVITNSIAPGQISVNNSSATYVYSGAGRITGATSLTKDGTGSLTLSESGGDDFFGGIIVNSGTLVLDNANSAIGGGLNINGGTVRIGNNDGNGAPPPGAITDNGSLVFARTNALIVSTVITGSGSVSQSGSGTLTLSGANTYTGNTIVNGGTLALSGAGTISNSPQTQVSNAGLSVSAILQSIFTGLNLTNSSVTVALNGSGTAPIVANALALGGANNAINVSAIPAIASYPVTFTVIQTANLIDGTFNATLGTVPAATPSYAGSVSHSGNNVVLTLTSGPVGTRPSVSWIGADVPNLNTNWSDRLNWQLPGAPTNGDTVLFDNNGSYLTSSLSTAGGGASALQLDQVNNLVDANFTISSLTYTNINGTYHNTHIADGKSLSITNSGALAVGSLTVDVGATNTQFVNISGPRGTLNVNNPNAVITVALTSAASGVHRATLDMSALGTFQASGSRLAIGSLNTTSTRPLGTAYLAGTNILTLGYTNAPGFTAQSDLRGLGVGDQADSATTSSRAFLYLGQTNRINVNSVGIGVGKAAGTLQFNPALTAANSNPSVWFRGADGVSPVAWWTQGDALGQTGASSNPNGVADFTGGTLNALVTTMYLGRSPDGANGGSAIITGTLAYDTGILNVSNLVLGLQPRATNDAAKGVLSVGANATLIATSLTLASATGGGGAANTEGTLNITNGTVNAGSCAAGTNGSISHINLSGGRMILGSAIANTLGTLDLTPLGTPDNSSNSVTLAVSPTPAISVSTLNVDYSNLTTNVINVGSVNGLITFPAELPLIQYSVLNATVGSTFNIGLGSLPPGYTGYLTNDTASSMIGLVILTAPPKPPYITSFGFQSGNLVASGTNGYSGQTYYIVASTNVLLPRSSWTRIATNTFDVNGNFTQTIPLSPTIPARFFSVQVQ